MVTQADYPELDPGHSCYRLSGFICLHADSSVGVHNLSTEGGNILSEGLEKTEQGLVGT